MFLSRLIPDRHCKGRFIGYVGQTFLIFYRHELRSLTDLFGVTLPIHPRLNNLKNMGTSSIIELMASENPPPMRVNVLSFLRIPVTL